jgi:hypothetical protein
MKIELKNQSISNRKNRKIEISAQKDLYDEKANQ